MEFIITYLPNYLQTQREMGYDDVDIDAVLFQQGYKMCHLLVKADDSVKIKREDSQATFQCDGQRVRLFAEHPYFDEVTVNNNN